VRFAKPPTTYDQQIDQLLQRGMEIPDRDQARHYLAHLNYYRIGAYWLPFEADHGTHTFHPGTRFDQVLDLYVFDRELRLLVLDAIERFEVSLRTQWAYQLAHGYGSHAYLDASLFRDPRQYARMLDGLKEEIHRSHETFISHYLKIYTNPPLPPIWAVCEVMSLGQLSKWYGMLKHRKVRNAIAKVYGLDETILSSFTHHLTIIRNLCAHHSRLWNRSFGFTMKLPRSGLPALLKGFNAQQPKKIYNTLVMLEFLMSSISPAHHWKQRLFTLFEDHPAANPQAMGFPANWLEREIWG